MTEVPERGRRAPHPHLDRPRARSRPLIRIVLGLAVVAGLGLLFVRSVCQTRSEPYTIAREHLGGFTVTVEPGGSDAAAPVLVLRTAPELAGRVFRQVFARAMESLSAPAVPAIPILLQGEFDRAFAGRTTLDALAAAAREAGLESAAFEPRCVGYRRVSEPRATRQLYFMLFDAPAFVQFRQQIGALLDERVSTAQFDPAALSPVLFIAASEATFHRWLPLRADPDGDCVAPIVLE